MKKKLYIVLLLVLLIIFLLFESISFNPLFLTLGRFHPLVLHLPIGALVLVFFLDILSRVKGHYPKSIITYALGFSAFFAILTCIFGYILSLEGGYSGNILDIHFWTGILSAVLIIFLFLLSCSNNKILKKLFLPFFILTLGCISIAGHYGSVLTHGSDFLTEHLKPTVSVKPITNIDSLSLYNNVVHEVFESKCIECHNSTKKKGGLSLASQKSLLMGGDSGLAFVKNNAKESLLLELCTLPISNENHMPPEGKPQLTKKELWLLEYWINNSDKTDDRIAFLDKTDTLQNYLKDYIAIDQVSIKHASVSVLISLKEKGFTIRNISPKHGGLWVTYKNKDLPDDGLKALKAIKDQIVELDLGNTNLSDDTTEVLKELKNLKKLYINNTNITDVSLSYLEKLKQLKILVFHNTAITRSGLENILSKVKLSKVYAWKTNIDHNEITALEKKYHTTIDLGSENHFY